MPLRLFKSKESKTGGKTTSRDLQVDPDVTIENDGLNTKALGPEFHKLNFHNNQHESELLISREIAIHSESTTSSNTGSTAR